MTDPVPSKDLTTQDGLRILGGFAMWSSPDEPQSELRAAARAVLHDRLSLIRQLEEMRVAAAKTAFEREPPHCSTCACGLAPEPAVDPLQTETRAATSRGARSTEDAGRSGPLCSECNNTRVVIVDGHENVCPDCCCWDCGVAPGEAHYSACEAVGRAAQPPRDGQ